MLGMCFLANIYLPYERYFLAEPDQSRDAVIPNDQRSDDVGAPDDPSLLTSYGTHVAAKIWAGSSRTVPLAIRNRKDMLQKWPLEEECRYVKDVVQEARLTSLALHTHRQIDWVLITAFTERWHPETNTFHLPFGEMTISGDDVYNILGIRMEGSALSPDIYMPDSLSYTECVELYTKYLGIAKEDIEGGARQVRLNLLRRKFKGSKENDSDECKQYTARAFLLYLVGCSMCPDNHEDTIDVRYLRIMKDLDLVGQVSWGPMLLAYLFAQLGVASDWRASNFNGCMTLLQTWIYEHFPTIKRRKVLNCEASQPRVHNWRPDPADIELSMRDIESLRKELDNLSCKQVLWDPYDRNFFPIHDIVWYTGYMFCLTELQPYNPERVLRQFGRCQTIPQAPLDNRSIAKEGSILLEHKDNWANWQTNLLDNDRRSSNAQHPSHCCVDYIAWYSRVSHPRIQKPQNMNPVAVRWGITARSCRWMFLKLWRKLGRGSVAEMGS